MRQETKPHSSNSCSALLFSSYQHTTRTHQRERERERAHCYLLARFAFVCLLMVSTWGTRALFSLFAHWLSSLAISSQPASSSSSNKFALSPPKLLCKAKIWNRLLGLDIKSTIKKGVNWRTWMESLSLTLAFGDEWTKGFSTISWELAIPGYLLFHLEHLRLVSLLQLGGYLTCIWQKQLNADFGGGD